MLPVRTPVGLDACGVGEYDFCSRGGEVRDMLVVVR
jgi:hypothetical protein